MKKLLCFMLVLSITFGAFAIDFTDIEDAKDQAATALNDFTKGLSIYVPNAALQQNVWASAYIGKLLPSVPPHFGGGATIGASVMDTELLSNIGSIINMPIDLKVAPLPTVAIDARIGGIFIPFDLGVHGMIINDMSLKTGNTEILISFKTFGADIRVPVLQQNIILPNISIGASYTHSEGGLGISNSQENEINTTLGANIKYKTDIVALTAQISKQLLFLIPYGGLRVGFQNGSYDWDTTFNADIQVVGNKTLTESGSIKKDFGKDAIFQGFFGIGLDFFVLQTTVGASYDFTNNIWAGSLSLRAKL